MRCRNWPEELAAALTVARGRAFSREYYCVTFAADCVEAITGEDPLGQYRGLPMEEALEKIKADGHRSFYALLVSRYGRPVPLSRAARGDIIVRTDPELATGICCGERTAYASDVGLAYLPTLEQRWCFRVP